MLPRIVSHRMT